MTDIFRKAYRTLSNAEKLDLDSMKGVATQLYGFFEKYPGRETAIAKTKLEEAVMWAVKGVTG